MNKSILLIVMFLLIISIFSIIVYADTVTYIYPNVLSFAGCTTGDILGFRMVVNSTMNLTTVGFNTSSFTGTKAYVISSTNTQLGQSTISGGVATFNPPIELTNGGMYYVIVGSDGANYCRGYHQPTFPQVTSRFNISSGAKNATGTIQNDTTYYYNIINITTVDIESGSPTNTVTLNYPTTNTSLTVNHSYTPTWYDDGYTNCTLFSNISGSWGATTHMNVSVLVNVTQNIIEETYPSIGVYIWNIGCFNSTNVIYATSNSTLTLTGPPIGITSVNIANNNTYQMTTVNVSITTDSIPTNTYVSFTNPNSVVYGNYSMACSDTSCWYAFPYTYLNGTWTVNNYATNGTIYNSTSSVMSITEKIGLRMLWISTGPSDEVGWYNTTLNDYNGNPCNPDSRVWTTTDARCWVDYASTHNINGFYIHTVGCGYNQHQGIGFPFQSLMNSTTESYMNFTDLEYNNMTPYDYQASNQNPSTTWLADMMQYGASRGIKFVLEINCVNSVWNAIYDNPTWETGCCKYCNPGITEVQYYFKNITKLVLEQYGQWDNLYAIALDDPQVSGTFTTELNYSYVNITYNYNQANEKNVKVVLLEDNTGYQSTFLGIFPNSTNWGITNEYSYPYTGSTNSWSSEFWADSAISTTHGCAPENQTTYPACIVWTQWTTTQIEQQVNASVASGANGVWGFHSLSASGTNNQKFIDSFAPFLPNGTNLSMYTNSNEVNLPLNVTYGISSDLTINMNATQSVPYGWDTSPSPLLSISPNVTRYLSVNWMSVRNATAQINSTTSSNLKWRTDIIIAGNSMTSLIYWNITKAVNTTKNVVNDTTVNITIGTNASAIIGDYHPTNIGLFYKFTDDSLVAPVFVYNSTDNITDEVWQNTTHVFITVGSLSTKTYEIDNVTLPQPNNVYLSFDGQVNQNRTYNYPITISVVASSSGGTPALYRDNVYKGTSESVSLPVGIYAYKANATGDSSYLDNATGVTFYVNISSGNTPLTLTNNISWTTTFPAATNVTATGCLAGIICTLYRNGVEIGSNNTSNTEQFGAGTYIYVYNTSGGGSYGATSVTNTLTINKATPSALTLSSSPSWTEYAGTQTTVTGANCPIVESITCSLYRNGIPVSNPDIATLTAPGSYNYIYNSTSSENYSSVTTTHTLTIIAHGGGGGITGISGLTMTYNQTKNMNGETIWNFTSISPNDRLYINIPKNATVTNAKMNLTGYQWEVYSSFLNPSLSIVNQIWNYTGYYTDNQQTSDFSNEINSYLRTCAPYTDGTCDVHIILHHDNSVGIMQYSAINITYDTQVYDSSAYEGQNSNFWVKVNASADITDVSGELVYNGVDYPYDSKSNIGRFWTFARTVSIPSVSSDTALPFYWSFVYTNSSGSYLQNFSTYYQNVYSLGITNCTSGTITLDFSGFNEEDQTTTAFNIDVNISYGSSLNNLYKNFNHSFSGNNTYQICLNQPQTIYANAVIRYYNSSSFVRYYYLDGMTLTNDSQSISLYIPNTSYSQTILTIQNSYSQILDNAKIEIERSYNGVYEIIAEGKTTGTGTFTFNLNPNIIYSIIITSSQGSKSTTLQPTLSSYTILIPTGGVNLPSYWEAFNGWSNVCTYDNATTPKLSCSWNDVSGHLIQVELKVYSITNDLLICDNITDMASGTFVCNLPISNNVTYAWSLFSKHGSVSESSLQMDSGLILVYQVFVWGLLGVFLTLIITLTFGFFALQIGRPTFIVFSTLLSIIFCFFMGFISPVQSVAGAVIGLIFAGGIIIMKSGG